MIFDAGRRRRPGRTRGAGPGYLGNDKGSLAGGEQARGDAEQAIREFFHFRPGLEVQRTLDGRTEQTRQRRYRLWEGRPAADEEVRRHGGQLRGYPVCSQVTDTGV